MARGASAELTKIIEDLTGQQIPLGHAIPPTALALLSARRSKGLGYSQFNELLVYLGYDRVSHVFFQFIVNQQTEYKSGASIKSLKHFRTGVDEFRKVALLFFGNVKFAFKKLSRDATFLVSHLSRFDRRRERNFRERHVQVMPAEQIPGNDTYYLGYLIRDELAAKLKQSPRDAALIAQERRRVEVVEKGKRNHDGYLVSDHLDVYIATSMRQRHEFLSVYRATRAIFSHPKLAKLNVRWFDPTQAYCVDRIDKGLAEGLMLKRAKCTIYFAQEGDTFGKDSELASTLAQGKPVIAFVPRPQRGTAKALVDELAPAGSDYRPIVLRQLQLHQPEAAWNSAGIRRWIDRGFSRSDGVARLQEAMDKHFEKRNKMLREQHPLGIQVNLLTGVANGVLVANTIDQCARLVRALLLRELKFSLVTDKKNNGEYIYLKETISDSVFRVVTGDLMLTNAFWNFYLNPSE
jgi:hypothetical protein